MTRRSFIPFAGFVLALAAVSVLDPPFIGRGGLILLVLLGGLLAALLTTIVHTLADDRPARRVAQEPADGFVPVVSLEGVESMPNAERPEIRQFTGLDARFAASRTREKSPRLELSGRVAVFSIFVGRDGFGWSNREIAEAYDSLLRMGRWLERQAASWRAPLDLELVGTYFAAIDEREEDVELAASLDPYENTIDEVDTDVRGIASAGRVAARLGFSDLPTMTARIDGLVDHERTVWFVHFRRAGRSRAIKADVLSLPGAGLALCYARESTASAPLVGLPYVDPVTLVHELLHLFSATDKYGTSLETFPRLTVTSRDVMRLDLNRLSRLRVDALTAWEVGWISSPTPRRKPPGDDASVTPGGSLYPERHGARRASRASVRFDREGRLGELVDQIHGVLGTPGIGVLGQRGRKAAIAVDADDRMKAVKLARLGPAEQTRPDERRSIALPQLGFGQSHQHGEPPIE